MKSKGKEIAGKSSGKRKRDNTAKSGGRKKKNPGVLQFFDVAADVDEADQGDESFDDSDFEDDFMDDYKAERESKTEMGKVHHLPFLPKEEDMSEEELERLLEERYRPGSKFVGHAEDDFEIKRPGMGSAVMPSSKDPTIWKVKCMVGRERHSAFCLMQKYVDLQSLGSKLQIVSAFAVEHVKGYIYIESDRECDVTEACKGLCSIYSTKMKPVPSNEVFQLFSVRGKLNGISVGMWARVKYGNYKGDLAQVFSVNDARKKATIKLIPRVDLQAMARKIVAGEIIEKKSSVPSARLISTRELEHFGPHIQCRRDRDTGEVFQIVGGLMLKDGYLYKKVSIESLSFSGVVPTADERLKFMSSEDEESNNLNWLSQLYGEKRKDLNTKNDKGEKHHNAKSDKGAIKGHNSKSDKGAIKGHSATSDKGAIKGSEGTSGTKKGIGFELHDLVFFGQKGFGIIVGLEENDSFQVLKGDLDETEPVVLERHELKSGSLNKAFTAFDKNMKTICIGDAIRILDGSLKDRQGIVKQIYRGTVFIYDENQLENSGYFCAKSQLCEKIKHAKNTCCKNLDDKSSPPSFEDSMASPKSPLSPKKPWQENEFKRDFSSHRRGDSDGIFSIGQTLRIRVGPLKGYLCRVIAIYHSDVTVKLDSQLKVLTVKCEHLCEIHTRSFGNSVSENAAPNIIEAFDQFGAQEPSKDWMEGIGAPAESSGWNSGVQTTERNSWTDCSAPGFSLDSCRTPFGPKKDDGDDAWGKKVTLEDNSSWKKSVADDKAVASSDQVGSWGGNADFWDSKTVKTDVDSSGANNWGKVKLLSGDQAGSSKDMGNGWSSWGAASGSSRQSDAEHCVQTESLIESVSEDQTERCSNKGDADEDDCKGWRKGGFWNQGQGDSRNGSNTSGSNVGSAWNKIGGQEIASSHQVGSWGKSMHCSDNKAAKVDAGGCAANNWEKAKLPNRDQAGFSKDAGNGWDIAKGSLVHPKAREGDQVSSWNKAISGYQTERCSDGKGIDEDTSWRNDGFCNQVQTDSWNIPKAVGSDGGSAWNKSDDKAISNSDKVGSWGKIVDCWEGKTARVDPSCAVDNWEKAKLLNRDQAGSSKDAVNSWGKAAGILGQPPADKEVQTSFWNTRASVSQSDKCDNGKDSGEGDGTNWSKGKTHNWDRPKGFGADGKSAWNKGNAVNLEKESGGKGGPKDSWKRAEGFDGYQGFGNDGQRENWNSGRMGTEEDADKQDGWGRPKSFDGGRGSGGRGGRGGNRGGRDHFNRGRSFGRGRSSGWNRDECGNHLNGHGSSSGNSVSGYNNDQVEDWSKSRAFDEVRRPACGMANQDGGFSTDEGLWNRSRPSDGNYGSSWNKEWASGKEIDESGDTRGHDAYGGGQSSGWSRGRLADNNSGDPIDSSSRWGGFGRGQPGFSSRGGFGNRGRGWGNNDQSSNQPRGFGRGPRGRGRGSFGNRGGRGTASDDEWRSSNNEVDWKKGGAVDRNHWQSRNMDTGSTLQTGGPKTQGGGWNNQGEGEKSQWQSWNSGTSSTTDTIRAKNQAGVWDTQVSGWNKSKVAEDAGGWNGQGSGNQSTKDKEAGWNQRNCPTREAEENNVRNSWGSGGSKELGSSKEAAGTGASSWNWSIAPDGDNTSGWNQSTGLTESDCKQSMGSIEANKPRDEGSGWNKGLGNEGGGWSRQGRSDMNRGAVSMNEETRARDGARNWDRSNAPLSSQSSGWNTTSATNSTWNQSMGYKEANVTRGQASGWKKVPDSSKKAGETSDQGWNGSEAETWNQPVAPASHQSSGWNTSGATNSTWNQSMGYKEANVTHGQASGWKKVPDSSKKAGETSDKGWNGSEAESWNRPVAPPSRQSSGWNTTGATNSTWNQSMGYKEANVSDGQAGGWNKAPGSPKKAGETSDQGWNGSRAESWNRPVALQGGQSSGVNQATGATADQWGKPVTGARGKANDGSVKGGW